MYLVSLSGGINYTMISEMETADYHPHLEKSRGSIIKEADILEIFDKVDNPQ